MSSKNKSAETYAPALWEKALTAVVALWVVVLVSFMLVRNKPFADPNLVTLARVLLCVPIGVFGATIPGFLAVGVGMKGIAIRSVGAIALAVLTYVYSPTVIQSLKMPTVLESSQFPPYEMIVESPSREQLDSVPERNPTDVSFSYKNETNRELYLYVYDFCRRHRGAEVLGVSSYWSAWPFPADGRFQIYDRFKKSNGWIALVAGWPGSDGRSFEYEYLATKNVFYSDRPALIVTSNEKGPSHFRAVFTTLDQADNE